MAPKDWEQRLHDSCSNGKDQRLLIDLIRLLKMGMSQSSLLANIFDLERETTASKHYNQLRLDPGVNIDSIDHAAITLKGFPLMKLVMAQDVFVTLSTEN